MIVAPLHNYAMPLIRYELGDFAEVCAAEPACERRLPMLRRIWLLSQPVSVPRRDPDLAGPIAVSCTSSCRSSSSRSCRRIRPDRCPLRAEEILARSTSPALTQRVRAVLAQPVDVTVHAVEKIERAANGKFEGRISLVSQR